jgi:hypothetical protein
MTEQAQTQTDDPKVQITERIENDFTYHPPKNDQALRYTNLRERAKVLAYWIVQMTPASREQSVALTKLEESIFWANAAIARNE